MYGGGMKTVHCATPGPTMLWGMEWRLHVLDVCMEGPMIITRDRVGATSNWQVEAALRG